MINYNGLFEILEKREMKKTDLLEIVSSGTLAKLNKNQNIQTEIINKICEYLKIQPGDIMEYSEIVSMSLISENDIVYKAGYKQMIIIEYPEYNDEFTEEHTRTECLVSKKVYENTDEIISGKSEIPKTFIREMDAYKKDPYLRNRISELYKK